MGGASAGDFTDMKEELDEADAMIDFIFGLDNSISVISPKEVSRRRKLTVDTISRGLCELELQTEESMINAIPLPGAEVGPGKSAEALAD